MFETKKDKLAQYGQRVWNISGNSTEEIAEKAIEKTVEFFHTMGMKTKISENTIVRRAARIISAITAQKII